MKKDYTHIIVILDRSGSMQKVCDDTIGGFNVFLEEQKKVPGTATMTLVQFSDKCQTTFVDMPLAYVAPLNRITYTPRGWTALNDAIGTTIDMVGLKLASIPENERPSKVIVLIITDGQENYSRDFAGFHGLAKVKEKVQHQTDKYNWAFTFVGANMDAFSTSAAYGISGGYTINYTSNNVGTFNAFKSVSKGTAATRIAPQVLDCFFENDANTTFISDSSRDTSDISETIKKYINENKTEDATK